MLTQDATQKGLSPRIKTGLLHTFVLVIIHFIFSALFLSTIFAETAQREVKKAEEPPIVVNGDRIEYAQEANVVTVSGNVKVIKGSAVLTCDKATVNTATNDVHAEGNVVLKDEKGIIKADSCYYNFKKKTGQAFNARAAYAPYYAAGKIIEMVSEDEIEIKNGYLTTCDKDHPHYRIQSRICRIFPEDKVMTKAITFRVANTPIMYLPKYTQNLKDDRMHVRVTPGKSKDWGFFLLTAWRYDLLQNSRGRIHVDFRERRDLAWGVDNYYDTKIAGQGYFKTYYMRERRLGRKRLYKYPDIVTPEKATKEKERYRIQWRHKWDIKEGTYWLAEYHKVKDIDFIKDYFFREHEKNNEGVTSSHILLSHLLADASTLSILAKKRTNRIFSETEKLPEIRWDRPAVKVFEFGGGSAVKNQGASSPLKLYFSSSSSYANFNKKTATLPGKNWDDDEASQRIDTYNRLSLPLKLSFLDLNPFVGARETYYQRIANRRTGVFRHAWDSGLDITTRFYSIFDFNSDVLGMEFNQLRHIIGPALKYSYAHPPTVSSSKLLQFDAVDSIGEANQIGLSIENKLQTKRRDKTVDFLRLIIGTDYFFNIEGRKRKWSDSITFDLEMLPYDWMRFESEATFDRKKDNFSFANFDLKASGEKISWGGGYRYERDSSSQFTGEIRLNLFKGWSFRVYERLQFKGDTLVKEQNYSISKELHCWILDINYNVLRGRGENIWFALRLKAFPEIGIDYSHSYHTPKPGSQAYQ
jgi:lipopolysaccharide assembly outer membrane protein LptD (OstA)